MVAAACSEEVVFRGALPAVVGPYAPATAPGITRLPVSVLPQLAFVASHQLGRVALTASAAAEGVRLFACGLLFQTLAWNAGLPTAIVVHATLNVLTLQSSPDAGRVAGPLLSMLFIIAGVLAASSRTDAHERRTCHFSRQRGSCP